jgi:hypothetical protein
VAETLTNAGFEATPALEGVKPGRLGARIVALPISVSLGGLVAVSAVVHYALALFVPAPWIFADELRYSELAKSFASTGHFAIRGVPGSGLGPLYPILISPAWALFTDIPNAYVAAKAINALAISLAAVPAYLLARRLLPPSWSLVAAGLAVLLPSTVYAGTIMTENLFYPLFVGASLMIVLALERPTVAHQLGALGLIGLAFLTRTQAVALVPAFVTAIAAVCIIDASGERSRVRAVRRALGRFVATWAALASALAAVICLEALRGRSVLSVFGEAQGRFQQNYDLGAVAKWFVYHFAELDLYVGILPFAAFLILIAHARAREDRQLRVFAIASLSIVSWVLLIVAFYTSSLTRYDPHAVSHIEDRYTFYVVPLLLVALLAWVTTRLPGSPRAAAAAAIGAGGLIFVLPLGDLIHNNSVPDTLAFLPWVVTDAGGMIVARPHVELFAAVVTLALALLFYRLRPPLWPQLSVLLIVLYLGTMLIVAERWYYAEGSIAVAAGPDKAWIDHAIGPNADAAAIWSGHSGSYLIMENELFNRSVGDIYYLEQPTWSGLPEQKLVVRQRAGVIVDQAGKPFRARYVLTDPWIILRAPIVARDPKTGMRLYRLGGRPARIGVL